MLSFGDSNELTFNPKNVPILSLQDRMLVDGYSGRLEARSRKKEKVVAEDIFREGRSALEPPSITLPHNPAIDKLFVFEL